MENYSSYVPPTHSVRFLTKPMSIKLVPVQPSPKIEQSKNYDCINI